MTAQYSTSGSPTFQFRPQLVSPPGSLEALLWNLSRVTLRVAANLRTRRIANARRRFEESAVDIPDYIRADIGLPPVAKRLQYPIYGYGYGQDVANYR